MKLINLHIAVIHSKMKIPLLILIRNGDIGGVYYKLAQKTILKHVAAKKITQSLNIFSYALRR